MESCKQRHIKSILSFLLIILLMFGSWASADVPTVSNVFDNTFIVDALIDISSQCNVSIVADSTVQGQITMTLDNVPLEEALFRILAPAGLIFKDMGGYYLVGAPDMKNPSFAVLSRTEVVKLWYTKAEAALGLLAETFTPYAKVDKSSNSIVITAPDSIVKRIKEDLKTIDTPLSQLIIEALIIDVSKDGRKDLGLDWRWNRTGSTKESSITQSLALQLAGMVTGVEYIPSGGLDKFLLSLNTVVANGKARVEANPRVTTLDGQAAEIFIGRDRYYKFASGSQDEQTINLEPIKTGITLKLIPQVADNGDITMQIEPEVSDVVADSNGNGTMPIISRRRVNTTVRMKAGDSIVLGGLVQRVSQNVKSKIPILGDIPILRWLFTSTKTVEEESEVLIVITCYLMDSNETGKESKLLESISH